MRIGKERNNYVSRAEGKLAGAVRAFSYDFRDKVVLDIGSSTGGFTELALKLGAKRVVAVEKGTNQMRAPLRFDERVELHEKCDIRNVFWRIGLDATEKVFLGAGQGNISTDFSRAGLERQKCHSTDKCQGYTFLPSKSGKLTRKACTDITHSLQQENTFDVILADVSFTSLRPILVHAKKHLAGVGTDFLVMLKPQFEAEAKQLHKGVVKNEKMRREIIKAFENWLKQNGFLIVKKRDNEVIGKNGNQERFYWLKTTR